MSRFLVRPGQGRGGDPTVPATAGLSEAAVRAAVGAAPEDRPVLGLGPGGRPVALDLDGADRHLAVEARGVEGPMILRALAAQALRHGARVTVLGGPMLAARGFGPFGSGLVEAETGIGGLRWAWGLPGVEAHPDAGEAHDALVRIEADARRSSPTRRHLVLVEDLYLRGRIRRWWARGNLRAALRTPPGLAALDRLVTSTSLRRLHVAWVTSLTVRGEPLVGWATRARARQVLVRAEPGVWAACAPDAWPPPRVVFRTGRVHLAADDAVVEVQVLDVPPSAARSWATGR